MKKKTFKINAYIIFILICILFACNTFVFTNISNVLGHFSNNKGNFNENNLNIILSLSGSIIQTYGALFGGLTTLIVGLLAYFGVVETIKSSQADKIKELKNDLDNKSEWRKELFYVASKNNIELNDVFRILTSIRIVPDNKKNPYGKFVITSVETNQISNFYNENSNYKYNLIYKDLSKKVKNMDNTKDIFTIMSELIFVEMNLILDDVKVEGLHKCSEKDTIYLDFHYSEKVRIYAKYLLKDHWDYMELGERDLLKMKDFTYETLQVLYKLESMRLKGCTSYTEIYNLKK